MRASGKFHEKTVRSRRAFTGDLIRVRVDEVELSDARPARREVVEHPGAVAIVPILGADQVVLVRQFRYATGRELLEIPAGTLASGESPRACAIRELAEETGYRPGRLRHLADLYLAPGYSTELIRLYRAEDLRPARAETDHDEIVEVVTLPLEKALGLVRAGRIRDAKTVCGLLLSPERSGLGAARAGRGASSRLAAGRNGKRKKGSACGGLKSRSDAS